MSVMRLMLRSAAKAVPAREKAVEETRTEAIDAEAFRLIFDRYYRPVTSFIYDMVNRGDLAEELAQETFVRAYRGYGNLRDESKLSTWLFGIAKNVAYESLRARRRGHLVGIDETTEMQTTDDRPLPDNELLGKELNDVIRRALGALDEDKRTVFTLKIFQQKSYEEISEITGHTVSKLKTDLHRARAEMRRRVGPYVEGTR
jgi:RNA polymerase sigma-70 factor (ECF subfamily)